MCAQCATIGANYGFSAALARRDKHFEIERKYLMKLEIGQEMHGFSVNTAEALPEIDGAAYTLTHKASGAKLLYLANDDENKAFSIAFKTPPADDTGVFHILEHSVLCGSEKFPVKEPFVNLLKTSMQTFLNAMTFGDKTLYPVASTNDQDLINLTDVYMDAVLHPDIYRVRQIFEQEGWHLELEEGGEADGACADEAADANAEGPASGPKPFFNGVVYNEMKGALSDATSVLYDELQKALFPDTPYAFESGGTPEAIPTLTYEHYLDEHARHYRLDNSYLTLYGNLDLDRMLAFLDERYLTPVAAEQAKRDAQRKADGKAALAPRTIPLQTPVTARGVKRQMVTAPENSCMAAGYVVGEVSQRTRIFATDILLDAIMGSNEAPLKRALLDAGIAGDAQSYLADSVQQPFAVIQLRDLREGAADRFGKILEDEFTRLAAGGLDHALVEASLSRAEFVMRERDYGVADGVALTMSALCGWLYDDALATTYLKYEDDFAYLREALDQGYFEQLIKDVFLSNAHCADVEIVPCETIEGQADEFERARKACSGFGAEDYDRIRGNVAKLRERQEAPDSPEALATLPQLHVSDISDAPERPAPSITDISDVPCIRHSASTRGLAYANRYYDLNCVSFEELPYVGVLAMALGKLGTSEHDAAEIDTLTNGKLGNLSFFVEVHEDERDADRVMPKLVCGASALGENADWLGSLPSEILSSTDFSDMEKIRDVLEQRRIGAEQSFANAGHSAAMARATSYYLPAGVVRQQVGGVDFYRFVKQLLAEFDARKDAMSKKLAELAGRIFRPENLTFSFAGSDDALDAFVEAAGLGGGADAVRNADSPANRLQIPTPTAKNEAFIVPSDVCYASIAADRRAFGTGEYSGAWQIAARALSYDFLWNEVRVKGGAYGAGFQAARSGTLRFYSFRDPHLDETLQRFGDSAAWLAGFDPTDDEMDGYIVSTVASFDAPLKTRALVRRLDGDYFTGRTPADRARTRREMIEATPAKLHELATDVTRAVNQQMICAFGNKEILESAGADLQVIDLLNE